MVDDRRVVVGSWAELEAAATAVRTAVFVVEQGVPAELELDELDVRCEHVVVFDAEGRALGTGRLLPDGRVGRMAVLSEARGGGVGSAILRALLARARAAGHREVHLHAQMHASAFYARHGFAIEGAPFVEADMPHVAMRRSLTGT